MKSAPNFKHNWKEYISFVKPYKWTAILILFIALIHEAKQMADKFIFKIAIDKATEFAAGNLALQILLNTLLILAIIFFALTFTSASMNWLKLHFTHKLEASMIFDLKQKYFRHIISLDHKFYTSHKTGSLISKLTRSSGAMERLTDSILFEFAPLILQLTVLTISLFYLDKFSIIILFSCVVLFVSFNLIMQRKVDKLNLIANNAEDIEKGNIADIFTNIDSIKYFGKEKPHAK